MENSKLVAGPSHYKRFEKETIVSIRESMTKDEFFGYLKGTLKAYLDRAGAKDDISQDLNKVCWYAMYAYLTNGGTLDGLRSTVSYMVSHFSGSDEPEGEPT